MGDPAGVGPELCLRALAEESLHEICTPIVFGDAATLRRVADACDLPQLRRIIEDPARIPEIDEPCLLNLSDLEEDEINPGTVSATCGRAAYHFIETAILAAQAGRVDAVCTAPINKQALHEAGVNYPGHTEIFTDLTGSERSCMLMTSDALTCSFVTMHIGYRQVPAALTRERILDVIELTADAMQRLRGHEPRMVVCGLNPHAGEHGLFGDHEEEQIIEPAIEEARSRGFTVAGPIPPDTAFLPQRREKTDAYICMYHDQGLIPLKMLAFDSAVNVTLGLPIIRTSVDHGTAFDIAWQGKANPNSLYEAMRMAVRLARA